MKLIDIHCHILPGVDDGPRSLEDACAMLDQMAKDNVCAVIATPHDRPEMFEASRKEIWKSYQLVRQAGMERGIKVFLGTEFFRRSNLEKYIAKKKLGAMGGTSYVLVEFSSMDLFMTIRNICYSLRMSGYIPIVAHVERYACLREMEDIWELKDIGACIQINADTVLGKDGFRGKRYAAKLLKEGAVDFIASDMHDLERRRSNLKACAAYVRKKYGEDVAKTLFYTNPLKMIKSGRSK